MPITIENKCGLILGVANERSIAWGISKVLSNSGSEIALSYQNENLLKRVGPLAESINAKICMLADVQNENSLDNLFKEIKKKWGKLDFLVHALAYSDKEELNGRFVNSSRENFLKSLDISCYSFVNLAVLSTISIVLKLVWVTRWLAIYILYMKNCRNNRLLIIVF